MDTSAKVATLLLMFEYRKRMLSQFTAMLHNNITEERHHRRMLQYAAQASPCQSIVRTGTEWDLLLAMDEHTFYRHLRVTRPQFEYLMLKFDEFGLTKESGTGFPPVPLNKKLLLFLWYMANQNSFRELADKFDVSQSTAHRVVAEALNAISRMGATFLSWPNDCTKSVSEVAFHRICGLRGIIGAIDGCHIRIQRPPVSGGDYMNRKGYYSLLLQGIVDERGRFIDIFVGPPGRVHDARMLRASSFFNEWERKMGEYHLLGDSAYIGQAFPFIITPKRDDGTLTEEDMQRNARVSRGRVVVEQAFGKMKCKWRRLRDLQNTRMDLAVQTVMAGCFLYNLCVEGRDPCLDHPHGCPREEDDNE